MGKTYKGIKGRISKLTQIGSNNGPGIRSERWSSTNLIRGGDGGGQYAGGNKKGRHGGASYLGYYIKSNLLIIDL